MEWHPSEDELVELALGEDQSHVQGHLEDCRECRAAYDDVQATFDELLPAAPSLAPPAGIEPRVLDRLDLRQSTQPHRRRGGLLVAAAAVIGLVLGVFSTTALTDPAAPLSGGA